MGIEAEEVEDKAEREEEERRRREATAEARRQLWACLPLELRDSL